MNRILLTLCNMKRQTRA